MTQRLPSLPNLGHLKKQAKDILRVSRQRSLSWRLADAQHALAHGYGFPSWLELKIHVESVRQQRGAGSSARRDNKTQQLTTSMRYHTPPSRFAKVVRAIPSRALGPRADRRPPGNAPKLPLATWWWSSS